MPYSFTEKKRIRKSFAKRDVVLPVPFLARHAARVLRGVPAGGRSCGEPQERGSAGGFQVHLPDREPLEERAARVRELRAGRAAVRREGVPAARSHVRCPAARQGAPGDHGQGGGEAHAQGGEGAGGLHGRDPAHDEHRLVRHQRHRARDRLAAAPLARACSSSTTAARRIPRASCCSRRASFPTAARGSTSSSIRRITSTSASTAGARCR
jgi:hypothetical protein